VLRGAGNLVLPANLTIDTNYKKEHMPDEIEDAELVEEQDDVEGTGEVELTVEEKIYNLTISLHDLKNKKKISNKIFSDEIKEINKEIEDLLKAEENAPAQPEPKENE
jgi:hypothetical protein